MESTNKLKTLLKIPRDKLSSSEVAYFFSLGFKDTVHLDGSIEIVVGGQQIFIWKGKDLELDAWAYIYLAPDKTKSLDEQQVYFNTFEEIKAALKEKFQLSSPMKTAIGNTVIFDPNQFIMAK